MATCRRTLTASAVLAVALGTAVLTPSVALASLDAVAAAPVVTVTAPAFIGPRAATVTIAPSTTTAAHVAARPVAVRRPLIGKQVLRAVTGSRRTTTVAPRPVTPTAAPVTQVVAQEAATTSIVAAPAAAALVAGNPLAGQELFVPTSSNIAREADRIRATEPAKAAGLDYIAAQPTGYWWGDWNPTSSVRSEVARHLSAASQRGTTPVYVVYNIMKRDGSGYSAGGAASLEAYRAWIDQFVAGVGSSKAVVVVEPDALNDLYNMSGTTRTERVAALRYALTSLKQAGIPAYLDAGGPTIHAPSIVGKLLTEAGIDQAQGFSVNVSNFQATADNIAWGTAVSALVGGKHFVIDTGRNGRGAISYTQDSEHWCNPPGRALGKAPTTNTGNALVDAYLWVKQPGESDGECRGFGPAGQFSADYAYGLYSRM